MGLRPRPGLHPVIDYALSFAPPCPISAQGLTRRSAATLYSAGNRVARLPDGEEGGLGGEEHLNRFARGRNSEQAAAAFLAERGYDVMARNQRTPVGELDLVCRDRREVVIVEVKARHSDEFGSALESIGPRKAKRLRAAALWWLSDRGMFPCSVRFDAVVVSIDGRGLPVHLQHLRDVIGAGG